MKKNSKKINKSTKIDKKELFLNNLKEALGNRTTACLNTGIDRGTYYNWIEKDAEFKRQCQEIIPEETLDFVETKLFELIKGVKCIKYDKKGEETIYERPPDNTSIIFYLKTKGKKRGYIEKIQTEHSGAIKSETDLSSLPLEKKKKILEIMQSNESK